MMENHFSEKFDLQSVLHSDHEPTIFDSLKEKKNNKNNNSNNNRVSSWCNG